MTEFSYKKLCNSITVNVDISLDFFVEHIYDDPTIYFILTKREIESLFVFKMMLINEQTFVEEFYCEVPEREDSRAFVFDKGGNTKYHLNADCHLLKNDYWDSAIPEEIKEFGKAAVDEYRNWFVDNNFMERYKSGAIDKETIIGAFNMKFPPIYGIKPIAEGSNLLIIEKANSGNTLLDQDFDVEEFKQKMQELKNRFYNTFTCKVHRTLAKQRYLFDKDEDKTRERMKELFSETFVENFGMANTKEKIRTSYEIVKEILRLLEKYIKWSYSLNVKDKDFDLLILEQFGLVCCKLCSTQ